MVMECWLVCNKYVAQWGHYYSVTGSILHTSLVTWIWRLMNRNISYYLHLKHKFWMIYKFAFLRTGYEHETGQNARTSGEEGGRQCRNKCVDPWSWEHLKYYHKFWQQCELWTVKWNVTWVIWQYQNVMWWNVIRINFIGVWKFISQIIC